MSRPPVRAPVHARTDRRVSPRRLARLVASTVAVLVVIGALFASGSDARKHRARNGTTAHTATSATHATAGVTQLTLHPKTLRTKVASSRTDPRLRAIGFRSPQRLDDHFAKHGHEFGAITKAQYLSMAQDLRDAPLSKTVIEATQPDGSIIRFNRTTGGFIAFNGDLTIRTFFRPNDGEAYFRRAAGRLR